MQIYDLMMLAVIVAAMIFGAWKGFVWQLASLCSLVVSYFVALRFSSDLAPHLSGQAPLNRFLAMLLIYVGCGLVIWVLFRLLSGLIDRVKLKEFDRQMGALTGLAKGTLLCVAITFFAVSLSGANYRQSILESYSGRAIGHFIERIDSIMPQGMHELVHPLLEQIEAKLHPHPAQTVRPNETNRATEPPADAAGDPTTGTASAPRDNPPARFPTPPAPAEIPHGTR